MQNAKSLETLRERERERERESCHLVNGANFSVAQKFQEIINKINAKNKDPCCGLRLLYLRL